MYKTTKFPNGSKLIFIPSKDTQAVTVFFLFGVGSRYEKKEINGVSHFIEHLMFKGTKKRPNTLAISKELDRFGAEFNAMTAKDYTGYYVKINCEKVGVAIDILSDMLLNSKFAGAEINRERGVIVEEINMYHDNPIMYIESVFEELVYDGHPMAWEISGPAEVIKNVSRKNLLDYKNKYYCANNLVIAIAGKIANQEQLKALLMNKFIGQLPARKVGADEVFTNFNLAQKKSQIKIIYKKTKQAQLAMGFPCWGYDDPRIYALHLLTIILGGNMSARLWMAVRERRGLAYFVRCYPNYYKDTGNIMIHSGLDNSRLEEAITVILNELRKCRQRGITGKELQNAKDFLKGKTILSLEDSSSLAEYYAKQELLMEQVLTPEQKMKKYKAVTVREIKQIANELFQEKYLNLALIGPFKNEEKFREIIKNF